ncbi:hypothetical protein Skr01_41110 [Sphaerisporangium krabiense]|uniref:Uncharacterized protein n=1 Tax=Sphaerisporangium krabiense TaxID=763782 RepID=A0A7W8Z9Q4_9ACTN|nr:hypothetical protein [Sphaerisporangium krabiense]MBB5629925.1 hypothetical protein [Sphaerisporangium krabiense]GII64026.1 hypothetical protein Skr01_41110 [Sphaerisporangium krabiense]
MRRRPTLWSVMLLTVTATLILGPPPARAAPAPTPTGASQRCVQGTDPDAFTILHLDGGRGQTYPPAGLPRLADGDMIRIEPDLADEVDVSLLAPADPWDIVTPAGNPQAAGNGYPAPLMNQYSLLVWAGGSPFQVSRPSNCVMPGADTVTLGINDPETWDNTGAWDVVVKLYRAPVHDGGFERQTSGAVSWPWATEGPDSKGIDLNRGFAHTFRNNAFIRTSGRNWNALTQQIAVRRNTDYVVRGFIRTTANINTAFFGVRLPGMWPPTEVHFGPTPGGGYQLVEKPFNSLNNDVVTVFAGFWGVGADGWMQMDDIAVLSS